MRSRVIPGSSVTIDRRCPINRLNSEDLPTFGRPIIAISGRESITKTFFKISRLILWDLSCLERCYNAINVQTTSVSLNRILKTNSERKSENRERISEGLSDFLFAGNNK